MDFDFYYFWSPELKPNGAITVGLAQDTSQIPDGFESVRLRSDEDLPIPLLIIQLAMRLEEIGGISPIKRILLMNALPEAIQRWLDMLHAKKSLGTGQSQISRFATAPKN